MRKLIVIKSYLMLYDETAKTRILKVLFTYPEKEYSLSQLAKEAGVAKANIGKILAKFQKAGLIKIEKLSKIWRVSSNQTSKQFIRSKLIYNLNLLYSSGLVDYLIDLYNNPKAIILFGSYRKGEDISTSDIDIAIESPETNKYQIIQLKQLSEFESFLKRKIQIHLFSRNSLELDVFNNIANGILLWGFLEVGK